MSASPALQGVDPARECEFASIRLSLQSLPLPLTLRPARPLSDEELLAFCAENELSRIERTPVGDLIVMTPSGNRTNNREGYIFRELDLWVEREGKGIAFSANLGVSFPDGTMKMPDGAWLSSEKWNSLSEQQKDRLLPVCPEFIVELKSPSDQDAELKDKMEFWVSRGAQLAWLIDPERKLAMIYRPGHDPETISSPEYLSGEGPIAGFRLEMKRFWD
jgi:Uma2 family endonuclease